MATLRRSRGYQLLPVEGGRGNPTTLQGVSAVTSRGRPWQPYDAPGGISCYQLKEATATADAPGGISCYQQREAVATTATLQRVSAVTSRGRPWQPCDDAPGWGYQLLHQRRRPRHTDLQRAVAVTISQGGRKADAPGGRNCYLAGGHGNRGRSRGYQPLPAEGGRGAGADAPGGISCYQLREAAATRKTPPI